MGKDKNTLTIKDWIGSDSLTLDVNLGYGIISKSKGGKTTNTLTVTRKSDKHSTRMGLFAHLRRNEPGYQTLGFPEITLMIDKYANNGQFMSRTMIIFSRVAVDSLTAGTNNEETIVFAFGEMTEMTISKTGVSYK